MGIAARLRSSFGQLHLDPPVLRPRGVGVLRVDRPVLAEARCGQPLRREAQRPGHVLHRRQRASRAELPVVREVARPWFTTAETGTRIKDRRRLALDAITVMSVERHMGSAPETRVRTIVHQDKIHVFAVHAARPNHRKRRDPPDPDQTAADFAVSTVRLAGFIPSTRQSLPGTQKLWEGYLIPSLFYANVESTVFH